MAPHPRRKSSEIPKCCQRVDVVTATSRVPVDSMSVGPICLSRNHREASLGDEPARYVHPHPMKLMGPMSGLAEKNYPMACSCLHNAVEIMSTPCQAIGGRSQGLDDL
jgi:hypothetical protein